MMDSSKKTRRWLLLMPLLVLVLIASSAVAEVDADDISYVSLSKYPAGGWINPTNFPVIDDDVCYSVLTEQPAAGQIDALGAHMTSTGAGVVVAVLDAGFNLDNPMIAGHLHPFTYDALDRDRDPNDSGNGIDDDADGDIDPAIGHGTFVAGMVLMAAFAVTATIGPNSQRHWSMA